MLHPHASGRVPRRSGASRPLGLVLSVLLGVFAAATPQLSSEPASAAETPALRPNILLITTDDQAATDMAYMPYTRRLLGRQGVTFSDTVSPYPLCCPARATIMTGQLSHNHHVLTNKGRYGGYDAFKRSEQYQKGVSTWLQQAGYHTMFVGKYLNKYNRKRPTPPGWTEWHGAVRNVYGYYDFSLIDENGKETSYPKAYMTDVFGDLTRASIRKSVGRGQPFFIWESDLAPHGARRRTRNGAAWGPPVPARRDADRFSRLKINRPRHAGFNERVVSDKPEHIRESSRWKPGRIAVRTEYYRERIRSLQAVDRSVRETVALLRELGELDNTLIIFTSDNGYLMGQHRWQGKVLPYEPSLRIPLLMRGPGLPKGVTRRQTAALVDVAPTIADAAGVVPLLQVDGKSLLPLANGEPGARGYGALSIESGPQNEADWPTWLYRGVRTHRYTYVHYPGLRELELYDRRKDPDQTTNVAYRPAYRDTRAALADKLQVLQDCQGTACYEVGGGGVPRPSPEPHLDSGATVHPDDLGSIDASRQVVTITARNWKAGRGRLTAWSRHRRTWTVERGPFRVTLGANGMVRANAQRRQSGETAAGTFHPETAFGLRPLRRVAVPYRRVDRNDYWVADSRDRETYNTNQRRRSPRAKWRTRHAVRWADHRSRFPRALLLDHNLPRRVSYSKQFRELRAGRPADVRQGSLVLHVGRRLRQHGWVSMDKPRMTWLLRWMRKETKRTTFVVGTTRYLRSHL